MLSVVFVNPPTQDQRKITRNCDCASESKGRYLLQPFDLLYLSARLPKPTRFLLVDAVAENLDAQETLRRVKEHDPDLVVQTMADVMWDSDFDFLKNLRQMLSQQKKIYVLGDALIEPEARTLVEGYVDGVISSPFYVEARDSELVTTRSFLSTDSPISKVPEEVSLGLPLHAQFQRSAYRWPFSRFRQYSSVVTSWGCPYKCSYCIDSLFPSIFRPVPEILEEIQLLQSIGIQEISITDKSFGIPKKNSQELLHSLVQMKRKPSWSTYLNPLQGDPGFLQMMADSGCHTIIIGIESQDHDRLKKYNRNSTSTLIQNVVAGAHKAGIQVCGDFLFGLNFQSKIDIQKNTDYALDLNLDFASFNIAAPLPGSAVKNEALADGRMQQGDHHFDSVGRGRALDSAHCTSQELISLRNQAVRRFYFRPSYLLRRLSSIRSWEQLMIQTEEMSHLFAKTLRF